MSFIRVIFHYRPLFSSLFLSSTTDRSILLTSGIKSGFPSRSVGEIARTRGNSHKRAKPSHGTGLKPLNFSPRVPCRFTTEEWCVSQGNSPPRSAIRSGFNVEGSGHSCIRGPVIHRRRSPPSPSMIENHTQVVRKYLSLPLSRFVQVSGSARTCSSARTFCFLLTRAYVSDDLYAYNNSERYASGCAWENVTRMCRIVDRSSLPA